MEPHISATQRWDKYKVDLEKWLLKLNNETIHSLKKPVGRVLYLDFEKIDSSLIAFITSLITSKLCNIPILTEFGFMSLTENEI